jgi:very-long-chain (3R)-3-hydroxyacyl-CoA dehydratase
MPSESNQRKTSQSSAHQPKKKNPTNANPNTESRTAPPLVKAYLVAYNLLSAVGWSLVLYRTLTHLFGDATVKPSTFIWVPSLLPASLAQLYTRACTTYDAVGTTTAYVQSGAVLEVLHVLLGLVRSPLPTTLVQVSSRLFSVWSIAARFPSVCVFFFPLPHRMPADCQGKKRHNAARSTRAWSSHGH